MVPAQCDLYQVSQFLARLPTVMSGKLLVADPLDDAGTEEGMELVPEGPGNAVQEISQFLHKLPEVMSGKLLVADELEDE